MARQIWKRAAPAAAMILLFISCGVFAQDSSSSPDSNSAATASGATASGGSSQDSRAAPQSLPPSKASGQGAEAAAVQNAPGTASAGGGSRRPRPDPELDAILQAERENRLADAEKLLHAAIQGAEAAPGSAVRLGVLLNHLASLKMRQGWSDDAIAAGERALAIDKKVYGPESAPVARDLSNLAIFRIASRKVDADPAAEDEYKQALSIARRNPGPRPAVLLMVLNNLAQYYLRQGRGAEAEPLIDEALQACQKDPAPRPLQCDSFRRLRAWAYRAEGHANAAEGISQDAVAADASSSRPWREKLANLQTLARQYEEDGTYDLAEANFRQALALVEANTKPDEPGELPGVMESLGEVLVDEGQNNEAEDLFKRALDFEERALGSGASPNSAWLNFDDLENLYRAEGRLADLEPIIQQGIAVQEGLRGREGEALAEMLLRLAEVDEEEKQFSDAQPLCARALKIREADYGPESPRLIGTIETCAEAARQLGETDRAQALAARARTLREKYAALGRH